MFSRLFQIAVPVALMAATVLQMMRQDYSPIQNLLEISLSSFPQVSVAVHSDSQTFSSAVQQIVTSEKATYIPVPRTTDLKDCEF